jgi:hypothetical protein
MGYIRKTAKYISGEYLYIPLGYSDLIVRIYLPKDGGVQSPSTTFLSQTLQPNPMPLLCYQCTTKVTKASACGFVFCSGVTTEIASLASPSTSGYKLQGSITEKATVVINFHFSPVSHVIFFFATYNGDTLAGKAISHVYAYAALQSLVNTVWNNCTCQLSFL